MEKKIALIANIHGNFSVLKAVLKDIEQEGQIDHILCLGDLIGIEYETNETILNFPSNHISRYDEINIKDRSLLKQRSFLVPSFSGA